MLVTQEMKERIQMEYALWALEMSRSGQMSVDNLCGYWFGVIEAELEKKVEEVRSEINVELKNYTQIRDNIVKDEQYEHVPAVRFTAKKIALEDILLLPSLHPSSKDKQL